MKFSVYSTCLLALVLIPLNSCTTNKKLKNPNVLFIVVDDLRPELNCYGAGQIHSPHIDQLAEEGLLFERAYCNVPVCGASRASLLTGLRPTRERFNTYQVWVDEEAPEALSLPHHFRNNGYFTVSNGKVFHHMNDRKDSWDQIWRPDETNTWRNYQLAENISLDISGEKRGPPFESIDAHDTIYFDGQIAEKSIADLHRLKDKDQPFFLAVGFLKPHLPFNAPRKYWDLYEYDKIQLPYNNYPPENAPPNSIHNSGELRNYSSIPEKGPVSDTLAKKLIQGYYACVSYTDAQIGKLLDALQELELERNTIVVLWGDHGWNLQEHTMWCKHCSFRTSQRSVLMMKAPGLVKGEKTNALAEYVDVYPTLCDLASLDLPMHLEGTSLKPLLINPEMQVKDFVISKWNEGMTIKTDRYAYTEWNNEQDSTYARMLYDHTLDLDENVNIAVNPEHGPLMDSLRTLLRENWGKDF